MGIVYEAYLTTKDQIGKEDWSAIYASLGDVPAKITKAYISNSSYWLSWFPYVGNQRERADDQYQNPGGLCIALADS
jgi:hypothetical protein